MSASLFRYVSRRLVGMSGPFLAAIVSRGGQTLLAVYLARNLGAGGYGTFIFATGAAILGGLTADFGWPNVVNREIPQHQRDENWGLLRGLLRTSDLFILLLGILLAGVMLICAELIPHLALGFQGAALLVVPMAFIQMRQQELAAVNRATIGMLLDQGMAATIVLGVNLIYPMDVLGLVATYAVATSALVLCGSVLFRSRLPHQTREAVPHYTIRKWLGGSAAVFGALLPRMLVTRFDVLLVAPFAGVAEAGLFGAALRLTLLMTFPQYILQTLVLPRFSRAFANGDHAGVRRLLVGSLAFATATTLPIILPIVVMPGGIMRLFFGDEFVIGGPALFWLGIGQFAIAASIPLNAMIGMGGDQRALGRQGLIILALTFVVGWMIIPRYGALGAAFVATGANLALTIGMCWLALPIVRWSGSAGLSGRTGAKADGQGPHGD